MPHRSCTNLGSTIREPGARTRTGTNELELARFDETSEGSLHLIGLLIPPAVEVSNLYVSELAVGIVYSVNELGKGALEIAPRRQRVTVSRMYCTRASWIVLFAP